MKIRQPNRHALADWLTGQGYVRHRQDPEETN